MYKYRVDKAAPNWLKVGRPIIILQEEGFNNQLPGLYLSDLVLLSKSGLQCDVFIYLYLLPRESNQQTLEGFYILWVYTKSFKRIPIHNVYKTSLVYEDSFDLIFVTSDNNDHGVIIVRVDVSCIFLREGDCSFWGFSFAFALDIGEVFYIQDLSSVLSTGGNSLPSSGESSCYVSYPKFYHKDSSLINCILFICIIIIL